MLFPMMFSLLAVLLSGCGAIETIFKTGVWTGVFIVVGIIALVIFLITRSRK